MSLSNPKMSNPATKFLHWCSQTNEKKGLKEGTFYYFDKENEKNVTVNLPLYFLVLDQLNTISGYHEDSNSGIYSNEVKTLSEPLNVRSFVTKGGFKLIGKYSEISAEIKAEGGKFTKSVYAVIIGADNQFEVVNFQLHGAAFAAWVEAKINTENFGVKIIGFQELKKGANKYQSPIFESLSVGKQRKELWDFALTSDKKLQAFIKARKASQEENEVAKEEGAHVPDVITDEDWAPKSTDIDDIPF